MTKIKALFSDIDGVLHPPTAIVGLDMPAISFGGSHAFTRHGLFCWTHLLEDALAGSADEIVLIIHSTWRQQAWATMRVVRDALGPLGHRFQGMTSPTFARQASIQDLCSRVGIEDYLILDDASSEFAPGTPNLVITNPLLGVSDPAVLQAVRRWAGTDRSIHTLQVAAA